ncbi:GNAT family N-acetyltransferase [Erysipelothrix anatis]|uniref:GNAT family N-acetyltransferase n=1 Tax=Erysipelothrix anatis TaxID=2683713 RepID=UPI0019169D84|nr:GNAT family N-acetyltransferase [Erysipelothrix anatis]
MEIKHIEPLNEVEITMLVDIWERAVYETHDFLQVGDFRKYKTMIPTYFEHTDVVLGAYEGHQCVGFAARKGENLDMLFVDPIYFGKGIGKQLLKAMEALGVKTLDVNEENPSAYAFYKAMGYRVVRRSAVDDEGKSYPILHMEKVSN